MQRARLPVSYWTEPGASVNGPGYRDGLANFDRPVAPRCLECPVTYFEPEPDAQTAGSDFVNALDPDPALPMGQSTPASAGARARYHAVEPRPPGTKLIIGPV